MALMEIKNLKKYFQTPGGLLHAVDDVSLSIEKGTTIGVVGESGCGKSTLGKTLMKLHDTTSGQIIYKGVDIAPMNVKKFKKYRGDIQMIFQDPYASLDPRMDVEALIAEPLKLLCGMKNKVEMHDRVIELMDKVKLAPQFMHSYPHELDGGRRQRIGIARALASKPDFTVCDEPVSALDVSVQAQVLNLLRELQEMYNLTYMFITHDMSVLKCIADEIMVMYLGQVVEKCKTEELFGNTLHPYSQALLSAIPIPSLHKKRERIILKGEVTSPIDPAPGCRFAPRCPYATKKCFSENPVFEEKAPGHMVACHII